MQLNELSVDVESSATSAEVSTDGEMLSGLSPNSVSMALPSLHYPQNGGMTRDDASLNPRREPLGRGMFSGGILSRGQFPSQTK